MGITLFVLPGPKELREKAVKSFGEYVEHVVYLYHDDFCIANNKSRLFTNWFCFIYSYEWIDGELREALPVLMENKDFDFFVFYKKVVVNGEVVFSKAPRLFRFNVEMLPGILMPASVNDLKHDTILDGWIRQDPHYDKS